MDCTCDSGAIVEEYQEMDAPTKQNPVAVVGWPRKESRREMYGADRGLVTSTVHSYHRKGQEVEEHSERNCEERGRRNLKERKAFSV